MADLPFAAGRQAIVQFCLRSLPFALFNLYHLHGLIYRMGSPRRLLFALFSSCRRIAVHAQVPHVFNELPFIVKDLFFLLHSSTVSLLL